ncbi:Ribosomal RNA small subunit methyltransferase I [Roseivivax sp. THAF40]|uniref:16S rRNA (cytidine(1402)-2'-O)-methyltransferase n=1 Tax=unclassified Roseivivax TaxID=2639302 RepID=UPI0012688E94|nr:MULTISPECIES: 16S rRNA (cytidine(1402)-2'-O)-methyltransferase [unclassified Roseivivax]QFS81895.1 Ribosomal RNA small subunit methyltransferase I [Roseivivax sp. THAF197b]QFT45695.1 Ribosomal RNA small subunit methyltransferase I [Roseivivax sp. THAF40]
MISAKSKVSPGLTLVSTPIGNARDITLRALDVLAEADILAAEDTRALRRLLEIHGVALGGRPCLSYHEHNGAAMRPKLLAALAEGKTIAYASEAGTPMISDPGFDLARAARDAGYPVTAAPGAAAVIAGLTVAGLPTDRFFFAGFLPNASGARRAALSELTGIPATLVFYESPKRLGAMLRAAAETLGAERPAAVCRELTKKFEEVRSGSLEELADHYQDEQARGEIVVLISRADKEKISESDVTVALEEALKTMSVRDAAEAVSAMFGVKKRPVYQQAMKLQENARDGND